MELYAGHYGEINIPEDKREELAQRIFEVMYKGGMAELEKISLYDRTIYIACPPSLDEDGAIRASYNYFDDASWNSIAYYPDTCELEGGNILLHYVVIVVRAIYYLLEFYSSTYAIMSENSNVKAFPLVIGWLNYLFDESYTNKRVENISRIHRLIKEKRPEFNEDLTYLYRNSRPYTNKKMMEDALSYLLDYDVEIESPNSFTCATDWAKDFIFEMHALKNDRHKDNEEMVSVLKKIYFTPFELSGDLSVSLKPGLIDIGIYILPHDFTVRVIAQTFDLDLNELRAELENSLPDHSVAWHETEEMLPVKETKLCEFYDGEITDDDCALFWSSDSDRIVFSPEMETWIDDLATEIKDIVSGGERLSPDRFLHELMDALHEANELYSRVYAPEEMFYYFIEHMNDIHVQAALILFKRLLKRNISYSVDMSKYFSWLSVPKKSKFSSGRMQIKRFLAIMANRELRSRILGTKGD